jgi:putative hydrolase of the HAD superfamily
MTVGIVFFDAGETLLHPHPSFPELFATTVYERGYIVTAGEVAEVQGRLAPHLVELAEESGVEQPSLSAEGSLKFWKHLYRRLLGEFGIDDEDMVSRLYEVFSSSASYKLFDDVLPTLAVLTAAGYRLGVISNFEEWLEKMLIELEVGHLFDVTIISGVAGVEKPDPLIYEIALKEAKVAAGEAVHVGDSPVMDVEPSASVGMRSVLLDRYGRYDSHAQGARIQSLQELPELLSKL